MITEEPFLGLPEDLVAKFKAQVIRATGSEEAAKQKWAFLGRCDFGEKIQCIEAYLKATGTGS
jgi:hypothetical protein